jgi:ureidoglycolate hydrolase
LFRTFASIPITKDEMREREIKAFAKDYGDIIARPQDDHVRLTTEVEMVRKHATMETWRRAIQHMHRAIDLWDRIEDPERHGELKLFITRNKGAITYRRLHHPLERKEGNDSFVVIATGKKLAEYPLEDIIRPARKALQAEIQDALTDIEIPSHTTPCLLMPELRLVLRPVNLLAYMWLSFARVVSGEIEERPCEMFTSCHEYIYVGSGPWLQRDDTTTCSAACRQKKKRQGAKKSLR